MAYRKFLTSVADVYAYDGDDNLLFTSKTLLDSSIEVSLGSTPVRGGKGNQLQYIYYHTGEMTFTLTDTQWNLSMLGETAGSDFELGQYYTEETVAVSAAGTGSIAGSPISFTGGTVYAWATAPDGTVQRAIVSPTTGSFTLVGKTGESLAGNYCVRYYNENASEGRAITISANMIPSVVKLVLETQLNSSDVTSNKIGVVQIIAPTVTLSGAFSISMTADGVSNTPLTATALAYTPASSTSTDACVGNLPYYAKIIEIIDNTNWYDNVFDLAVSGGDFSVDVGSSETMVVYAIPKFGSSFKVPNADLTFASAGGSRIDVGAHSGSVTGVYAGSATAITIYVTSASTVDTTVNVTVTS